MTVFDIVQEALKNAPAAEARIAEAKRIRDMKEAERTRKYFQETQKLAEKLSEKQLGKGHKIIAENWMQEYSDGGSAIVRLFDERGAYLRYQRSYFAGGEALQFCASGSTRITVFNWDQFSTLVEQFSPKKLAAAKLDKDHSLTHVYFRSDCPVCKKYYSGNG